MPVVSEKRMRNASGPYLPRSFPLDQLAPQPPLLQAREVACHYPRRVLRESKIRIQIKWNGPVNPTHSDAAPDAGLPMTEERGEKREEKGERRREEARGERWDTGHGVPLRLGQI